jgi:hypothetical protein
MKKGHRERIIIEFEVNGPQERTLRALQRAGALLFSIFVDILKDLLIEITIIHLPDIKQLLRGVVMILNLPLFTAVVALMLLLSAAVSTC